MPYETPDNLVELLDGVLDAASRTAFYPPMLAGLSEICNLDDLGRVPVTPLETYRRQRLADVLAEPAQVEWIAGPYNGRSVDSVAVAEGPSEVANRYGLLADAVKERVSLGARPTCAVVTTDDRRYFASEVATILISLGVPSHVFTDDGSPRTYELLRVTAPQLLVLLSGDLAERELPASVELCITFRRSHRLRKLRQLDVYVVDELGFLGHSSDCKTYTLNKDVYYFERSDSGRLVVTALHNRVRPMLRLETMDSVRPLGSHTLELARLAGTG